MTMNLEWSPFDRTSVLILVVSILGLVRERRPLPFLIAVLGGVVRGTLIPVALASWVTWHRMVLGRPGWLRAKDLLALLFFVAGSVSSDPLRAFFAWTGTFLLTFNYGGGALGPMPGLLLLGQFVPAPEALEWALGFSAFYWVVAEVYRWVKWPYETEVLSAAEAVSALAILFNFRTEMEAILAEPLLFGFGIGVVLVVVTLLVWVRVKGDEIFKGQESIRAPLEKLLSYGERAISPSEAWSGVSKDRGVGTFDESLNRLVYAVVGVVVLVILAVIMGGEVLR